jgi:hypothetical protein
VGEYKGEVGEYAGDVGECEVDGYHVEIEGDVGGYADGGIAVTNISFGRSEIIIAHWRGDGFALGCST